MGCRLFSVVLLLTSAGCGDRAITRSTGSTSLNSEAAAAAFTRRVGIAVATGSRTCVAIRNANLALSSPVTLVILHLPQSFTPAQIGAASDSPCPITKELDTSVTNYELHLAGGVAVPKLTPMIAVIGPPDGLRVANTTVEADLLGDGKVEMFRSCSADDGVHLTLWSGTPHSGALLWHGYYFEASNPGLGAPCTPQDTKGMS